MIFSENVNKNSMGFEGQYCSTVTYAAATDFVFHVKEKINK